MFILMFRFQIQLLILISAGFLIRKIKLIDASARNALSTVLIYVIMPANIFNSFLQDDTGVSLYGNMGILLLISFLVQLGVYHLGSRFYRNEDPKRSPVFCYGLLNAGMAFVGLPVVENLYASLGTLYASVYMIPYWIIIAADNMGNSVARDQFMKKAEEELIEEEYDRLQELLELQKHKI